MAAVCVYCSSSEHIDVAYIELAQEFGSRLAAAGPTALQTGSLSVLAAGPIPPNPGDFFGSAALAAILREIRDRFDTILIEPPVHHER